MPDANNPNQASYWLDQVAAHERRVGDWRNGSRRIVQKFAPKPDRAPRHATLWAHAESALPALYAQPPSIIARRRHRDADPDGRLAAEVLQRGASAVMEPSGYDESIGRAVLDLILVGRGAVWVRYDANDQPDVPVTRSGDQWVAPDGLPVPDDLVVADESGAGVWVGETRDEIALLDYVHWSDLAHSEHRTWHELTRAGWVGRRTLMPPMQFRRRFGREGKPSPVASEDDYGLSGRRDDDVLVWEIWDTRSRDRIMVSPGIDEVLERRRDPYGLPEFLPCAIVWGSRSNENLVPMADWTQVERLADEVEDSSERLGSLIQKVRMRGAFDNSAPNLARLLDGDQDMVGVDSLQSLVGRGDGTLASLIQFVPLDPVVNAIAALYQSRDQSLATIREIGGFDGGAQNPQGSATESRRRQLSAGRRLERRRRMVERFARNAARLLVGVTARLVPPERLREESAFDLLPEIAGLEPAARDERWATVSELLKSPSSWRIDVETDSTIETDLSIEERAGFLSAIGDYLRYALPAGQSDPALAPALGQLLLYSARTWRAGRSVESVLEDYVAAVDARAQQQAAAAEQAAQNPPQEEELDPEQMQQLQRLELERRRTEEQIAAIQQRSQIEGLEGQLRIEREAARLQAAQQRLADARLRSARRAEEAGN